MMAFQAAEVEHSVHTVETAMQAWFPTSISLMERNAFNDADLSDISNTLRSTGRQSWSQIPRIYATLRIINQLPLIDVFITEGLSDVWFPFTHKTLPESLKSQTARNDFLAAQRLVLTKALDLEKEDGKHRHFSGTSDIPLVKLAELGRGGHGIVEKVRSTISQKEYARKLIPRGPTFRKNREVLKSFENELATLKKLSHLHIVELIGSYTDPRYVGILMSPIADCNLNQYLSQSLTPNGGSLLRTSFGCLVTAVKYLHENHIRHKDIKPQNILVKGHQILVTDFGISRDWTDLGQSTTVGPAKKTPQYCAPEVAADEPRNTSSDIWSLGCVFLEIWSVLCGETLQTLKAYFMSNGSNICYHNNVSSVKSWHATLMARHNDSELRHPGFWISMMMKLDCEERCTAQQLFDAIYEQFQDPEARVSFIGFCCTEEDDTAESVQSSIFDPAAADALTETTTKSSAVTQAVDELLKPVDSALHTGDSSSLPIRAIVNDAIDTIISRNELEVLSQEQPDKLHNIDEGRDNCVDPAVTQKSPISVGSPGFATTYKAQAAPLSEMSGQVYSTAVTPTSAVNLTSQESAHFRYWTRPGFHRVEAAFMSVKENNVFLRDTDGVEFAIPLADLSLEDLEYVQIATGESFAQCWYTADQSLYPLGGAMAPSNIATEHPEPYQRTPQEHSVSADDLKHQIGETADIRAVESRGELRQRRRPAYYMYNFTPSDNTSKPSSLGYKAGHARGQISEYSQHEKEPFRLPRHLLTGWTIPVEARDFYDQSFASMVPYNDDYININQAIGYLSQSMLYSEDLKQIRALSDPTNRGKLSLDEFAVAMHLTFRKLLGHSLPARLPQELQAVLEKTITQSHETLEADTHPQPLPGPNRSLSLPYSDLPRDKSSSQNDTSGSGKTIVRSISIQRTMYQSRSVDSHDRPAVNLRSSSLPLLQAVETPEESSHSRTMSLTETSSTNVPTPSLIHMPYIRLVFITAQQQLSFEQLFKSAAGRETILPEVQGKAIFRRSKLSGEILDKIWNLSSMNGTCGLLCPQFCLAMYLCTIALKGREALPSELPDSIVASMAEAVNAVLIGHMKAGQPLNEFQVVPVLHDAIDTPSSRDVDLDSESSMMHGNQVLTKMPDESAENKGIQLRWESEHTESSEAHTPRSSSPHLAEGQIHDLCNDFYCRRCPKPVIDIIMVVEERLETFSLPLVLLHPSVLFERLRFMLNILPDQEAIFERYLPRSGEYTTLDITDDVEFGRMCLDARVEASLTMRTTILYQSLPISDADWVPASPTREPPLPPKERKDILTMLKRNLRIKRSSSFRYP